MKFKSLKSPLIIQLSPETKQALTDVAQGCKRSSATLGMKVAAAKTAFRETTLPPVAPLPAAPSTPTCFVD
jgi:hypothetical protein